MASALRLWRRRTPWQTIPERPAHWYPLNCRVLSSHKRHQSWPTAVCRNAVILSLRRISFFSFEAANAKPWTDAIHISPLNPNSQGLVASIYEALNDALALLPQGDEEGHPPTTESTPF